MTAMQQEEWRLVPSMPGLEVSNLGRFSRDGRIGIGWRDPRGYRWVQYNNDRFRLHRLIAEVFLNLDDTSVVVRHLNDNPSDNRLENLALGTQADNMQDLVRNGNNPNRRKTHCRHGHPFDEANTSHTIVRGGPVRICITCRRERVNRCAASRRARGVKRR